MYKQSWSACLITAVLLAASLPAGAQMEAFPNASSRTATVIKVKETKDDPCGSPWVGAPVKKFWNLREGKSQFRLELKSGVDHHLKRVKPQGEAAEMEAPTFYVFNAQKSALTSDACMNSDSYKNYPFAFAIHDITDPDHPADPATPHALMYVPAYIQTPDPGYNKDQFYLLVFNIQEDENQCKTATSVDDKCMALHELWEIKENGTPTDLITGIWDRIDRIRLVSHSPGPVAFHNGVIHGNL